MKKKSNFIVQGSILAMAGILSRIIGNFVILKFYGKDIRFLKKM